MQEKKYVATLMRKTNLGKNCFIYAPTGATALIGTIDDDTKILSVDDNCEYYSMEDPYLTLSEENYAYANPITTKELRKMYPTSAFTYKEMISRYNDDCNYIAYLTKISAETGLVITTAIDLEQANVSDSMEIYNGYEDGIGSSNELVGKDFGSAVDFILTEDNIDEFDDEQLSEFKISLTNMTRDLNKLVAKVDDRLNNNTAVTTALKEDTAMKVISDIDHKEELFNKVKETIKGQDEALRDIILSILKLEAYNKERKGILITGDSGCGKTEIMKLIAENMERPFIKVNSKQLTSAGYVGEDIEEVLYELYKQSGYDKDKTENAIIYFDEIDKLGSSKKDNVNGQGVLNSLLAFLDGVTYKATPNTKSGFGTKEIAINTSKMIVIAGGAFSDVYHSPYDVKHHAGFLSQDEKVDLKEPSIDDFVEKGMMTYEFMGRFPVNIHLKPMTKETLMDIFLTSSKSPLVIDKERFDLFGVKLETTDEFNELLVDKALKKKTGARSLSIYDQITNNAFDYVTSNRGKVKKIVLTEDTITDTNKYEVELKEKELVKE